MLGPLFRQADLVVVGGGPAGATAALYAARADLDVVVVDKGLTSGALGMTGRVENYPGLPGATGAEIVESIRRQAAAFGADFVQAQAIGVDFAGEMKTVYTSQGDYRARAVILATGAMARARRVPGEEEHVGRGVSYCATCDAAFFRDRRVAVVGGSDEAVEEALFAATFASELLLLVPEREPKARPELLGRLEQLPHVRLLPGHRLLAVVGDGRQMEGIRVRTPSGEEKMLEVAAVFVYLQGNRPETGFLGEAVRLTPAGCVEVDENLETSVAGVYAAGDLLCGGVKQAVLAAAQGARAAIEAERRLRGRALARVDWK
ncbi:MAG: FAD-dependent oxidoreductase [Clostridia bacterium]|nr:FAD-dependent oxidoreductase [Clostridia bacterium]MCL6521030.1 FAD-dependent oxidoreductase [Bacillota bacterium]